MSSLWIMVGSAVVVVLLILNIILFRRYRKERRKREETVASDKEAAFLQNCQTYHLSARETEVLRLILAGHSYRTAAELLFISEKTVETHVRNIYGKSGVRNKVELVIKFYS